MKKIFLLCFLWLSHAAFVCAEEWQSDPKNSRLEFEATYEKQPIKGMFTTFDCHFHVDKTGYNKLDVTVNLLSADMSNTDINEAIKTATWFNAVQFPQAEFHSQVINQTDATHFVAQGFLQIKNIKKQVEFPFVWADGKLTGTTQLNRTDFNIGTGEWASDTEIGHNVKVDFSVMLVKVD